MLDFKGSEIQNLRGGSKEGLVLKKERTYYFLTIYEQMEIVFSNSRETYYVLTH